MKNRNITEEKWCCPKLSQLIRRKRFVKKHGFYPQAHYESYAYFIEMWKDIFQWYRDHRTGDHCIHAEWGMEANDRWYEMMIDLLDKMDEMTYEDDVRAGKITFDERCDRMNEAKEEFFKEFSQYFYDLWD